MKKCHILVSIAGLISSQLFFLPSVNAEELTQVCNRTSEKVVVANAFRVNNIWNTEGWFSIGSNKCLGIFTKIKGMNQVYLYAKSETTEYVGTHQFCVDIENKFKYDYMDDCTNGYVVGIVPVGFAQVTYMGYQDICITPKGFKPCE